MSRPMLLVFLLLILIITSQFEWKQQLVIDLDTSPSISQKQQHISKREEAVKEKGKKKQTKKKHCVCNMCIVEMKMLRWMSDKTRLKNAFEVMNFLVIHKEDLEPEVLNMSLSQTMF
ncbi:hypothetical protein L1049_014083 [Liquidambar formosana]|uniref:Transmembrane protein n=1 Tax=Liquidambar formosana TaxID=63359 RepID=A0AAP0RLN4_LIQFO